MAILYESLIRISNPIALIFQSFAFDVCRTFNVFDARFMLSNVTAIFYHLHNVCFLQGVSFQCNKTGRYHALLYRHNFISVYRHANALCGRIA